MTPPITQAVTRRRSLPSIGSGCKIPLVALWIASAAGLANLSAAEPPIESLRTPFDMPRLERPRFPRRQISIADFGAVADGHTLNVDSVQKALDACHAKGGGTVLVPAGRWLTTPFELRSNVNLHLATGAALVFTDEKKYYLGIAAQAPARAWEQQFQDAGAASPPRPLISAFDCENIAITGSGVLDGQGLGWWPLHQVWWEHAKAKKPAAAEAALRAWRGLEPGTSPGRPKFIHPVKCRNVLLEGFTAVDGPEWMVHPLACENVIMRRLIVRAAWPGPEPDTPNTDGINPESCRNVLIEDCDIRTGDDSIAIKSGRDEPGRRRGLATENVVIRRVRGARIAIGSEMSGGIRNILIRDCTLAATTQRTAINIKTRRGRGGIVENVWVENVEAGTISEAVIKVDMEYWAVRSDPPPPQRESVSDRTPRFRNLFFSNIRCLRAAGDALAISLAGLPEMPLENVSFHEVHLATRRGIVCRNARGVEFEGVTLDRCQGPACVIASSTNIALRKLFLSPDARPVLVLRGSDCRAIHLDSNATDVGERVQFEDGASGAAMSITRGSN